MGISLVVEVRGKALSKLMIFYAFVEAVLTNFIIV